MTLVGNHARCRAAAALALLWVVVPAAALAADAAAGQQKAAACVACHGPGGNSTQAEVPSLAGQPAQFLVSALFQFREGRRASPIMAPIAAPLSNADLNDLAAFFSQQKPTATARPIDSTRAEAGRRLTEQSNCVACHARNLLGQQHIPRIAGQQHDYLKAQLIAFRASTRGELDGVMTSAAQGLSPQDIDLLAAYLASLSPTSGAP